MTDVLQWLCMMSRQLRDTVRRFHLEEAREYWPEVPEGAWRDAEVLSYVHSGRALFPWRRGFEGIRRRLCTVDFSHGGLMRPNSVYKVVSGCRVINKFPYKGHKALRWRPWPMVFLSPERIIRLDLSFQDAGYWNATHWHRQLFGLLDRAHEPSAQEEAAFPPPVLVVLNRI